MKGKEIDKKIEKLLEEMKLQKMLEKEIYEEPTEQTTEYFKEDKLNINDSFEKAIDLLFGNESSINFDNEGVSEVFHLPYY